MLRDAHRRQEISVMLAIPAVKQDDQQIRWLWEWEQELIWTKIDDLVRRAFFQFLMRQGVRPGEARALRWDPIDLHQKVETKSGCSIKGVVIIDAAIYQQTPRPRTKTGRIRILPLHLEVREALSVIPGWEGYLFTFRNKTFNRKLVDRTWRRAAKAASFDGVTCYLSTRHSTASQAINSAATSKPSKAFWVMPTSGPPIATPTSLPVLWPISGNGPRGQKLLLIRPSFPSPPRSSISSPAGRSPGSHWQISHWVVT